MTFKKCESKDLKKKPILNRCLLKADERHCMANCFSQPSCTHCLIWAVPLFSTHEYSGSCGDSQKQHFKYFCLLLWCWRSKSENNTPIHKSLWAIQRILSPFSPPPFLLINIQKTRWTSPAAPLQTWMNSGERKAPLPFTLDAIQQNSIFASSTGKHHMALAKQEYRGGEVSGTWERQLHGNETTQSVLATVIHTYVWQCAGAAPAHQLHNR